MGCGGELDAMSLTETDTREFQGEIKNKIKTRVGSSLRSVRTDGRGR